MRRLVLTGGLMVVLTVAACASPPDRQAQAPDSTPLIVFRSSGVGPRHPMEAMNPAAPLVVVSPDGVVFALVDHPDARITRAEYRSAVLTDEGIRQLLSAASEAGLEGSDRDLGFLGIADVQGAEIEVRWPAGVHRTTAQGFWETFGEESLTDEQRRGREALRAFTGRLVDLEGWLGTELQIGFEPYRPDRWALLVAPVSESDGSLWSDAVVRDWEGAPLASLGRVFGGDPSVRCAEVDLAFAEGVLSSNAAEVAWRSDGATYHVYVRPLLPHEPDCSAAHQ